jgi:hypothetical protein
MHDQPGASEEEQDQAPDRLEDEEAQRGTWKDNPQQGSGSDEEPDE